MIAPEACRKEAPLLTVAMPIFNAGIHLRLALLSVMSQTFENWELILIDDGSTDASIDSVADIVDFRVRIIRDGRNLGLAARLNEAVSLARGRFFARMDQDDICHPERFALQLQKLHSDSLLDLIGAQCLTISERNEILGLLPSAESHEAICAHPWLGFYLPHPTWMGRTQWFRDNRYASPGPYCCEDQELLLRTYANSRFQVLPEILLAYRLRDRISWRKAWRTRTTFFGIQVRYFMDRERYLLAALATMALVLRVGRDSLNLLKQFSRKAAICHCANSSVSKEEALSWQRWIRRLESQ